jgi:hypothetical protein
MSTALWPSRAAERRITAGCPRRAERVDDLVGMPGRGDAVRRGGLAGGSSRCPARGHHPGTLRVRRSSDGYSDGYSDEDVVEVTGGTSCRRSIPSGEPLTCPPDA